MGKLADRIHTDRAEIVRLEALISRLPNDAHVELQLEDGGTIRGTVAARPTMQLFEDGHGNAGMNAIVRIEDPALETPEAAGIHDVWVDRIVRITRM